MKKFTKGCLITALILFIFGCAFWGIFGLLGGFDQLDSENYSSNGVHWGWRNGRLVTIWDDNVVDFLVIGEDWDDMENGKKLTNSSKTRTDYRASDITVIDVELGGCNLVIEESEDDYIWIANEYSRKTVKYGMKNDTFKLRSVNKINFGFWNRSSNGKIYLYLPEGMELDTINMEIGAGKLDHVSLKADTINLEAGAGTFDIEDLRGDTISISIGAGKANIDSIIGGTVFAEAGAGSIAVKNLDVKELVMEVGMGDIAVDRGIIAGNVDVECNMGNISMILQGEESEYNYDVECGMGEVRIGDNKYGGMAYEKSVDNGSRNTFYVECGMGNIDIDFVKE